MKIQTPASLPGGRPAALALLLCEGKPSPLGAVADGALKAALATGDLARRFRVVRVFHPTGRGAPRRLITVGLGAVKELTAERLRRAAARAQQRAEALEVPTMDLLLDSKGIGAIDPQVAGRAVAEGLVLGAYRYRAPKKAKAKTRKAQSARVHWRGAQRKAFMHGLKLGRIGAEATCFARDLENRAGNLCTPSHLAREARKLAGPGLRVQVLDEARMKKLKMNALLGVSRGSREPAKLIIFDHHPRGARKTLCIVGKGLTFDSGGISMKPSARMDEMRYDMCGGGAVFGLFHALRHGGLAGAGGRTRIVGVVAASENLPDGDAQKPGDVVTAMDGTTIEVLNTDAEGRLILADALCYAVKTFKPDRIVDLATLTGAVVAALGHEMAGVMGTDRKVVNSLIAAGKTCDEPLWELPLWAVHKDQMKSRYADLANINSPSHGNGSIAGGAFLSCFVGDVPWAHIDIAGAAWGALAKDYYKSGATGTAVRTLLHWVRGES